MSGPLSVVVPTIGRPEQLDACLRSVAACRPEAGEVLVVDQSGGSAVPTIAERHGARALRSRPRGVGSARNLGLAEARHETVLVTDDDCTVDSGWVGAAGRLAVKHPGALLTGRVLPVGDPRAVPSTIVDREPRDFTGELSCGALFPNNMVVPRARALELGGFDDRVRYAEDNDFCYRWLRGGLALRYEPELLVWHHDWRDHEELNRLYVRYYRGQGRLYAKHLRAGDLNMLRFVARDAHSALRSLAAAALRRRPRWSDPRRGIAPGLLPGMLEGWRVFGAGETAVRRPPSGPES